MFPDLLGKVCLSLAQIPKLGTLGNTRGEGGGEELIPESLASQIQSPDKNRTIRLIRPAASPVGPNVK